MCSANTITRSSRCLRQQLGHPVDLALGVQRDHAGLVLGLERPPGGRVVRALADQLLEEAAAPEGCSVGGQEPAPLGHQDVVAGALLGGEIDEDPPLAVLRDVALCARSAGEPAVHFGADQRRQIQVAAVRALRRGAQPEAPGCSRLLGDGAVGRRRQVMHLVHDQQPERRRGADVASPPSRRSSP